MRDIFLISDTHWNDTAMLSYRDTDNNLIRPFDNVEQMNQCMFDKWNDIVKPHDIVYHLGDVYIGKWDDRIAKLPGRKRLVIGNHDQINDPNFNGVFSKIMLWRIFTEYKICLTHIPIHMSDKKAKYDVNVHGHIHTNKSPTRQHINVSVEAIDFAPVSIDTLAATIVHKDVGPPLYDA